MILATDPESTLRNLTPQPNTAHPDFRLRWSAVVTP